MAIQVRRGNEVDFDPSKMLPGEWAVSLDTKYVRMCFSPGICLRMATYEAFEADMAEIQSIMAEARTIQEAVARIQTEINDTAIVVEDYAILSKSYAVGGTASRVGEDTDNAKYYYEQAKHISQGLNGLIPIGTIAFENLPTEDILTNGMYNISNDFTSDERFLDGGGVLYGKGSNVYYTVNGLWDVLASSDVNGVKGSNESEYRQGNVSLSAKDVGALPITGGRIGNDDAHIDINGTSIVGDTNSQITGFDAITAIYFHGDLNGTAAKAEQDKDGNYIPETYLKKEYKLLLDSTSSSELSDSILNYDEIVMIAIYGATAITHVIPTKLYKDNMVAWGNRGCVFCESRFFSETNYQTWQVNFIDVTGFNSQYINSGANIDRAKYRIIVFGR